MAAYSLPSQSSSALRPSPPTAVTHSRSSSSSYRFLRSNDNPSSIMPFRTAEPGLERQVASGEHDRLTRESHQLLLPSFSALDRSNSLPTPGMVQTTQLHGAIRSVVDLTHVHAHQVYMSGQKDRAFTGRPPPIKHDILHVADIILAADEKCLPRPCFMKVSKRVWMTRYRIIPRRRRSIKRYRVRFMFMTDGDCRCGVGRVNYTRLTFVNRTNIMTNPHAVDSQRA